MVEHNLPMEARWYEKLEGEQVRCRLCAHECRIRDGHLGICGVRKNQAGTLFTLVYGHTIAQNVDPIEKKPLYHFHPGSRSFSIATPGCNFRCSFCQNADISQVSLERPFRQGRPAAPQEIVDTARSFGCHSISYTYTEPTVFSEYAIDTARLAHEAGLANVFVSNGYMTERLIADLHPFLDAANIDLKAFRDDFYRTYCGARLAPVLESLRNLIRLGVWIEVTTLLIPGANDDPQELGELTAFIACEMGNQVPWHISRFHPTYKLVDRGPTPAASLERAAHIGKQAGLRHIYIGNLPGTNQDTCCQHCHFRLIERMGFIIKALRIQDGKCPQCQTPIAGRWD